MKLETFALERLQSIWENRVELNVSESGVHPLRVEELVDDAASLAALMTQGLGYPQTNGTVELRTAIAAMYAGATPDHVEVTNGGSEANCLALMHLVEPGDEVVVMTPNYMQVLGLASGLGAIVRKWPLVAGARWAADLDALGQLVGARTRMILICNPNNPTGARLTAPELDAIGRVADRAGAWVLSDEIYRGAELDGIETADDVGTGGAGDRHERIVQGIRAPRTSDRMGCWTAGNDRCALGRSRLHVDRARRDQRSPGAPGACSRAPCATSRAHSRHRARELSAPQGLDRGAHAAPVAHRPRSRRHCASSATSTRSIDRLIERLRDETSVLVVPGDHFEMDGYLRIGFGSDAAHLIASLDRIGAMLDTIPAGAAVDAR